MSEAVELRYTKLTLTDGQGRPTALTGLRVGEPPAGSLPAEAAPGSAPVSGGAGAGAEGETPVAITADLPALAPDLYHVAWSTVSSDDLHATSGVLVFGVQTAVPTTSGPGPRPAAGAGTRSPCAGSAWWAWAVRPVPRCSGCCWPAAGERTTNRSRPWRSPWSAVGCCHWPPSARQCRRGGRPGPAGRPGPRRRRRLAGTGGPPAGRATACAGPGARWRPSASSRSPCGPVAGGPSPRPRIGPGSDAGW